jgi:ABC-type nickel/cobalt efflux system permease component RcnA
MTRIANRNSRHCEPKGVEDARGSTGFREAIHLARKPRRGLLRCARNDGLWLSTIALWLMSMGIAHAQFARNPFSLGVNEGSAGEVGRIGLWLLQEQARFFQALRLAFVAAEANPAAALTLAAVAFAYGVFHAAGPGHGKAVIASYMIANETALRRGMALSVLAALLQAVVAIAIVGVAAILLNATARTMAAATHAVEVASYFCIAGFGLWMVWRKGAAFIAFLRAPPLAMASRFSCDDGSRGPGCLDCVAPDPRLLGESFSWRQGLATVVAAGARPCSGALLVLVFAASQKSFGVGIMAVFAMAAGTAITTAALAASAVLIKGAATRLLGAGRRRAELIGRLVEVAAACVVFGLGATLLAGLFVAGVGI